MKLHRQPPLTILFWILSFITVVMLARVVTATPASHPTDNSLVAANTSAPPNAATNENTASSSRKIIAYYFHMTRRCSTCVKIEKLTKTALQQNFAAELKTGILEWRPVNVDDAQNRHFIKDYQLYTKSVVLADIQNGQQIRWKNLDQIWQKVGHEDDFKRYIQKETAAYIKGK